MSRQRKARMQPYPPDKLTSERNDAIVDMVSKFVCYTGSRTGVIVGFTNKPAARLFRAMLELKAGVQLMPKGKGWDERVMKALRAFRVHAARG